MEITPLQMAFMGVACCGAPLGAFMFIKIIVWVQWMSVGIQMSRTCAPPSPRGAYTGDEDPGNLGW